MREQHGVFGGFPSCTFTKPNRSAHTPNLIVSVGQLGGFEEEEGGFLGTAGGLCLWPLGGGGGHDGTYVELTTVKKRRLRDRRIAALEAISKVKLLTFRGCLIISYSLASVLARCVSSDGIERSERGGFIGEGSVSEFVILRFKIIRPM